MGERLLAPDKKTLIYKTASYMGIKGVAFVSGDGIAYSFTKILNPDAIYVHISINGANGDKIAGKDVFQFRINKNGLYGFTGAGAPNESIMASPYGCGKTSSGECCGGKIQNDGWQILDDYPW